MVAPRFPLPRWPACAWEELNMARVPARASSRPAACVINGPTCGGRWSRAAARADLRTTAEGVPLVVIQRQLGHSDLGITSVYLQGIDNAEIIDTVMPTPRPGSR